jgi:endonuclease YncB( thermonuclease family)
MRLYRLLVFFAVIILLIDLAYFYPQLTGKATASYEIKTTNLTRAIDGDTIDTDIGRIRLLGINTPEKKQPGYQEAKDFLKNYEGKEVKIEIHEKDKYNRTLGYIFYNNRLLNEEILKEGLANLYVYEEDSHFSELAKAEESAQKSELGIWKKSGSYGCVEIIEFKYTEQERCNNQEQLVLNNKCGSLNLTLKDDANHIYTLNLETGIFTKNFSCVFNDAGDSLFLRDEEGLVLYYRYPD